MCEIPAIVHTAANVGHWPCCLCSLRASQSDKMILNACNSRKHICGNIIIAFNLIPYEIVSTDPLYCCCMENFVTFYCHTYGKVVLFKKRVLFYVVFPRPHMFLYAEYIL